MNFWITTFLLVTAPNAFASTFDDGLEQSFRKLEGKFDGRLGICVLDIQVSNPICVNGDQKFPLQSVMKLVVAAVVMDAVDHKSMSLDDQVVVRPEDASPGPQDFANLARAKGSLKVNIEELIRRSIVDSDSTSVDILIKRLGGTSVTQDFLKRKKIEGIQIDRDERQLQAESVGLAWRPEFADSDKFEAAVKALPAETRDRAWKIYLKDPRDTSTPVGMVHFLSELASGRLLSLASTKKLLAIMSATMTGRDRLKAGIPKNWRLGHKTGTGRTWKELVAVTNDVGVLVAPDGGKIAIAVFVAESKRSNGEGAAAIAKAATLVTTWYDEKKRGI